MITLYHYVHCPFCVRVRLALGYLQIPYESVVLPYDDEETPVKLAGKKSLPILKVNGEARNESLDLIEWIDTQNKLNSHDYQNNPEIKLLQDELSILGEPIHSMLMPHWVYTPEFNEKARQYFVAKKSIKRGSFIKLAQRRNEFEDRLKPLLSKLSYRLSPFLDSETFSLKDIMLASHLWGLYILPEFQFDQKLHTYLQTIKKICDFNYHEDLWREK